MAEDSIGHSECLAHVPPHKEVERLRVPGLHPLHGRGLLGVRGLGGGNRGRRARTIAHGQGAGLGRHPGER